MSRKGVGRRPPYDPDEPSFDAGIGAETPVKRAERRPAVAAEGRCLMGADPHRVINAMVRVDSELSSFGRFSRSVTVWEMDIETLKLIAGAMNPDFDLEEIELIEPQCLGRPVRVVERPGVRLVITVVES
jgi:hypothetical protein